MLAATRNQDPDDNIGQRGFSERSNNLNKPFRQPTRSSSFYSELDFRNQEFLRWDDDRVNTTPCPSPPFRDLGFTRRLSTTESQQITDELNRVRRYRNVEETLPQQNWWGSGADLGHSERQSVLQDHQNFMQRGKSALNEKQPIGNTSYCDLDALLYEPFPNVNGQRTTSDCYTQNMQLSISIQELSQQIRNLNAAVSANKAATRDALMQQRFDLHNMTRNIRDVSDMISESTKRIVTQISSQTRLIVDIEARLRRLEDNQRVGSQKISTPRERERDWQVPGRPDVMLSQELPFQFGVRDPSRETDNGTSNSMLNNQIPPGTRANNYWDNFRSYSRQNMLSKSNANVHQTYSHEPSPSAAETTRYSTEALNHSQLYTDVSPGSLDSGRRNGGVKNSWATSGFYENMSSKKRNKDQKSQSTFSSTSKVGSSTQPNSTVPESLHTSHTRDAHPEPDENRSTPTNRQQLHSILSPRLSPFRREPEPRRYSHFSTDITDLYWPQPSSEVTRKANFERDMNTTLFRGTDRDRESSSSRDMLQHRDVHLEENNPNSQSSASKIEREKHIQKYEQRASDGFISLDDTRSTNQEVLDTTDDNTMPDWATSSSRHDESSNTLEGPSSTGDYRSPLSSPLLRHVPDNIVNDDADQTDRSNEGRGVVSPPNLASHSDVPLNIRCEESNALENSLGRSTNRSDTSGSNNL
ncbi:hypothetical protein Ocin01_09422 [Orchesella cincta]|uniref:Uncharacterized protein n=1 Tax=Orchesella cincta TaxID=48709 RepID=A0A1D2MVZ7_ORCCI|nr:hypothetical protein Ocin01_09422 [Orchesella cincta]